MGAGGVRIAELINVNKISQKCRKYFVSIRSWVVVSGVYIILYFFSIYFRFASVVLKGPIAINTENSDSLQFSTHSIDSF